MPLDLTSLGATGLLAAGGGSVAVQLVQWLRGRAKDRGEAESFVVGAAHQVVDLLRVELEQQDQRHRSEIDRLRGSLSLLQTQLEAAEAELDAARREISQLKRDLAAAGGAT